MNDYPTKAAAVPAPRQNAQWGVDDCLVSQYVNGWWGVIYSAYGSRHHC
jgi:hypothetical protein